MLFNQLSARENINSVECSSCHVIALTNMGTVYSCGDGSHGQLGHGELEYCRYLRLISAFVDSSSGERILITAISAGSDETSSHSAAIDSNNNLFTWGKSIVCGHVFGEQRECTVPKKLNTLEVCVDSHNFHLLSCLSCMLKFYLFRIC
jgi:alpha-tubulin suppressor-like RCC1 family protein